MRGRVIQANARLRKKTRPSSVGDRGERGREEYGGGENGELAAGFSAEIPTRLEKTPGSVVDS